MPDQIGEPHISIIPLAKKHLLENTNIETSKDEMACLDSFLFRCWQMGWLKEFEKKEDEKENFFASPEQATKQILECYPEHIFFTGIKERLGALEKRLYQVEGLAQSAENGVMSLRYDLGYPDKPISPEEGYGRRRMFDRIAELESKVEALLHPTRTK